MAPLAASRAKPPERRRFPNPLEPLGRGGPGRPTPWRWVAGERVVAQAPVAQLVDSNDPDVRPVLSWVSP